MKTGSSPFLLLAFLPLLPLFPLRASDPSGVRPAGWPQWRGPGGEGVWRGMVLPSTLARESVEEVWRVPIGGGYSGVAVSAGRVLTMDRRKDGAPGERVLCLDVLTGNTLWIHEYPADYGDLDHGNGPRSTPAIHDGRVYTLGTMGQLSCLDLNSGAAIFGIDTRKAYRSKLPIWGHAASPLVIGDLVLIQAAAPDGTLVALDRKTGAERWRALAERPGYSTPILSAPGGKEQVIHWSADGASGLTPATGKVLWRFPFRTSEYDVAIISPVQVQDEVFVSGYWDGAQAFSIGGPEPEPMWKSRVPSCLMATPLYRDGHLYALDRKAGFLCVEWKTGKVLWNDGHRLTPKGQNPHASMVWAGDGPIDRAAMLNSEGHLVLARLGPRGYEEEGRVPIIGETWAHPAFAGQEVYARSDTEMVCVRVKGGGPGGQ